MSISSNCLDLLGNKDCQDQVWRPFFEWMGSEEPWEGGQWEAPANALKALKGMSPLGLILFSILRQGGLNIIDTQAIFETTAHPEEHKEIGALGYFLFNLNPEEVQCEVSFSGDGFEMNIYVLQDCYERIHEYVERDCLFKNIVGFIFEQDSAVVSRGIWSDEQHSALFINQVWKNTSKPHVDLCEQESYCDLHFRLVFDAVSVMPEIEKVRRVWMKEKLSGVERDLEIYTGQNQSAFWKEVLVELLEQDSDMGRAWKEWVLERTLKSTDQNEEEAGSTPSSKKLRL